MNNQEKILTEEYEILKEEIYENADIINNNILLDKETDLLQLNEYLPNLLRKYIDNSYYLQIRKSDNYEEILKKMMKTRKQSNELNFIEFINWIDTHEKFKDIINEDNVKEIADDIENLEKEYNLYMKII